jgi:hypothetical protein
MVLCGQISIELTVDDFVAAADHQRRIQGLLNLIRQAYPDATLTLRERRQRRAPTLMRAPPGAAAARPPVSARYGEA